MNYHLLLDEKFSQIFINTINQFESINSLWIFKSENELKWVKSGLKLNEIENGRELISFINKLKSGDKLFLHGLIDEIVPIINNCNFKFELNWIIWGYDLYMFLPNKLILDYDTIQFNKHSKLGNLLAIVKLKFINYFDDFFLNKEYLTFLKKVEYVLHYNKHDIELLNRRYGLKIEMKWFFYKNISTYIPLQDISDGKKYVLIGNSANPTNNHFTAISLINRHNKNFSFLVPLSYSGDESYKLKLVAFAEDKIGDRFVPLFDFLTKEKYAEILSKTQFAVMNHIRSQGMGNIILLIQYKKTLLLNLECTTCKFLDDLGIQYGNIKLLKRRSLDKLKLDETVLNKNKEIIDDFFSEENYQKNLGALFT